MRTLFMLSAVLSLQPSVFRLLPAFFLLFLTACILQPTAFSQSVIRPLAWEVDTARPAQKEWPLTRGETVDLECRYLSGPSAMDVRGASVVLHARTNGMPADLSFQVTGRVGRATSTNLASVGWVTVRLLPDLDLPHDAARCTFVLETTLNNARNLVATGVLRLSGDPTGATPAAIPVFRYDDAGSAQAVSNALAGAVQSLSDRVDALPPPPVVPVVSVNGSTGAVTVTAASLGALTAESDPVAGPRLALLEGRADNWDAAYGWGNHALAGYLGAAMWQSWLGTNTYVKAETDSLALAALATQRVERVWAQDGTGYRDGTGGVWRIYDSGSTTGWVAVIPDIPEEIAIPGLAFPVASVWEGSDVSWSMTVEATGYPDVYDITFNYIGFGAWDAGNVTSTVLPIVFQTFTGSGPTQPMRLEWRGAVTTQMVDTVALVSQIPGIVYSNAVSQMVVWTNTTGAVTNMAVCEGGTWKTNAFGAGEPLPGGIITNGQSCPFSLGPIVCTTNTLSQPSVLINTDVPQYNATLAVRGALAVLDYATGNQRGFLDNNGFGYSGAATFGGNAGVGGTFNVTRFSYDSAGAALTQTEGGTVRNTIRAGGPSVIGDSLQIGKTNTAAVVRSQSGYLLPHLGTNTTVSLIFTNGTIQAWEIAP